MSLDEVCSHTWPDTLRLLFSFYFLIFGGFLGVLGFFCFWGF